jgi:hypothetical protein
MMNVPKLALRILIMDCLGAVLSAILLGGVLAHWESFFGMPKNVLYILAFAAFSFALFTGTCLLTKALHWRVVLRMIASANVIYCIASVILMVLYWDVLTVWGLLYFSSEKITILILVAFEVSVLRRQGLET